MRITFVLPGIGFAGGIRAVFECSNRLMARGHTVHIIYPLIIKSFSSRYDWRKYLKIFFSFLNRLFKGQSVDWFDLKAVLIRIPFLAERSIKFVEKFLPESDIVVATAAETAFFVSKLDKKYGEKFYFVQHYEAWEIWSNPLYWEKLGKGIGSIKELSLKMPHIETGDNHMKAYKDKLDSTYLLPLKQFTTSTWLERLLKNNFHAQVIGKIDIGNNFDVFGLDKAINKNGKKVLMPLRGADWKGDADGLRAFELIKNKLPDIEFILYGSSLNQRMVPPWVKYYADISDADLCRLYSEADVFVLPSWVEGWSSPPMEAMACGTACVCTDVGAISDYTIPNETAILVPARNPQILADAVIDLLQDEKKRNQIAQAGYQHVQKFTWERTVAQMEKLLCENLHSPI